MPENLRRLKISTLTLDPNVQPRVQIDNLKVEEYAEAWMDGAKFPPIMVFSDGKKHWVSDGFLRVRAAKKAGKKFIEAEVREGTKRDAILHSVGCNHTHGVPRTNEDRWRAVGMMVKDSEWRKWSDREIARRCRVAWSFVGKVRKAICAQAQIGDVKCIRNGKEYSQKVCRRRKSALATETMELLRYNPLADSPEEIRRLSHKSPEQQVRIVEAISTGKAHSVNAAAQFVKREDMLEQLDNEIPELKTLGKFRTKSLVGCSAVARVPPKNRKRS